MHTPQLDLPHLDGTVDRVRGWTIRIVHTRGPEGYCGAVYGVRVTHDGGNELVPGWALCHLTLDEAKRKAQKHGAWLRAN